MVSICTTMTVNNMEIIPLKVTGGIGDVHPINHWATPFFGCLWQFDIWKTTYLL